MKKFIITFLFLIIATPAFSAPNFDSSNKAHYYDISDLQSYAQQLKDNYYKKYLVEVSPTEAVINAPINAWNNEVEVPIFEYMAKHPAKYLND